MGSMEVIIDDRGSESFSEQRRTRAEGIRDHRSWMGDRFQWTELRFFDHRRLNTLPGFCIKFSSRGWMNPSWWFFDDLLRLITGYFHRVQRSMSIGVIAKLSNKVRVQTSTISWLSNENQTLFVKQRAIDRNLDCHSREKRTSVTRCTWISDKHLNRMTKNCVIISELWKLSSPIIIDSRRCWNCCEDTWAMSLLNSIFHG